jgi:outer membrane immunogenic protein
MKRVVKAGVALAALWAPTALLAPTALWAPTALAADAPPGRYMPPPRAPAYVPFFSWSGLYVGVNAGYGFGHSRWTNSVTSVTTGDFNVSGAVIGGTAGYNMQLGSAVVGVEADLAWSNIKGSTTLLCLGTCQTSNSWLGTARGRIGYAFDRFLPYLTAGAAFGDIKGTTTLGSFSRTNIGWTAGGGLEYAFVNNWSAKLEYLYVDLGKVRCDDGCIVAPLTDVTLNTGVVRAGVNYKF